MELSKTTVGIIAALCVAGGAGGVSFVTGDKTTPVSDAVSTAAGASPEEPGTPSMAPVSHLAAASPSPAPRADARVAKPAARAQAPTRQSSNDAANTPSAQVDSPSSPSLPTRTPDTPVAAAIVFDEPAGQTQPQPVTPPPAPALEEVVVAADSVVGLQIETSTTSEEAEVEDEVIARVTRDVRVGDRIAIPAGAKAYGEVTLVERGGRLQERARLGVRFTSVVLADYTRIPVSTNIVYREGNAPSRESAAKIGGGAVGGAILGGILGGARGAAIGGSLGAGAGAAATLAGGRNPATLPNGTPVTVRLAEPLTVTIER